MNDAILITYERQDALEEAQALCTAAGYRIVHTIRQRFLQRPKYGISDEIIERLEDVARRMQPKAIIYDEVLKPSQNYNLASRLHRDILDREALILEIFEARASSSESKLQVKLAKMRYELGRAKEKVRLARMGEQPGFMGIGKFEVDVYYNDIMHRMQSVRSKLKKSRKQRELHRSARRRTGFRTISLAGYTSAGKTTLFNALTGERRERNPGLFTTLSTTIRRLELGGETCLISDTVGFISKLPAYMIEAFRSTLEEMLYADLVLLVSDASDARRDFAKKFQSCSRTLAEIGVAPEKILYVLNKSDIAGAGWQETLMKMGSWDEKRCVCVSAATGENLAGLGEAIRRMLDYNPGAGVEGAVFHGY